MCIWRDTNQITWRMAPKKRRQREGEKERGGEERKTGVKNISNILQIITWTEYEYIHCHMCCESSSDENHNNLWANVQCKYTDIHKHIHHECIYSISSTRFTPQTTMQHTAEFDLSFIILQFHNHSICASITHKILISNALTHTHCQIQSKNGGLKRPIPVSFFPIILISTIWNCNCYQNCLYDNRIFINQKN